MDSYLKKKIFIFIILAIFIIFLSFIIVKNRDERDSKDKIIGNFQSIENVEWLTYEDEKFNFKIQYPSNWQIFKQYDQSPPVISFYPNQKDKEPPFAFYDDTMTIVSVYPQGSDTEALSGKNEIGQTKIINETNINEDYLLQSGDIWATFVNFQKPPDDWTEWGFIWSSVEIKDVSYGCERNNEKITIKECNPFTGDQITRSGELYSNAREIEIYMLESFEFVL